MNNPNQNLPPGCLPSDVERGIVSRRYFIKGRTAPVEKNIVEVCPTCKGEGKILDNYNSAKDVDEYKTCPDCNGLGVANTK